MAAPLSYCYRPAVLRVSRTPALPSLPRTPARSVLLALALGLLSVAGCAPEIGDKCSVSTDCSVNGDRICDTAQPGGYCTVQGCDPDSCPNGGVCVEWRFEPSRTTATYCMSRCRSSCRNGYECVADDDERLESGGSLRGIAGTYYRDGERVVKGPDRASVEDLDSLASPHDYFDTHILMTSRGCPWACTFCGAETSWGRGFRGASVDYVLRALERSVARLPVKLVQIKDDTFTTNKKRVFDICKGIRARGLQFFWSCDTRVDLLTEPLLKEMRLAGCQRLSLGVESGSQEILDKIDKKITPDEIIASTRMAKKYGIKVRKWRKNSSGIAFIERPNKISFRYDPPNNNRIVSDGTTLKVYVAEDKQMFESPVQKTEYPGAFAFLMGKGISSSFNFSINDKAVYPAGTALLGKPVTPTPAYETVQFFINKALLEKSDPGAMEKVLIVDAQGNKNRFTFEGATQPATIDASEFTFTPPAGTNISR